VAVTLYLVALYSAIRVTTDRVALERFPSIYVGAAAVATVLAAFGFALALAGVETRRAFPAGSPFPYLGSSARAQAFTPTPNMLASILMLGFFLVVFAWRGERRMRVLLAAVIGLGFLLTLSKAIVCLAAGLAAAAYVARQPGSGSRFRLAAAVVAVSLSAVLYAVTPHFIVVPASADRMEMERVMLTAGDPVGRFALAGDEYMVLRTNYYFNKRTSIVALRETWPVGVGPGRQQEFAGELQREGRYPQNLWLAAPHSTYLGVAAEAGLAGLLGLVAFLSSVTLGVRRLGWSSAAPRGVAAAAVGALVALGIEGINTDVMHFRHYWWLAAIIAGWASLEARDERVVLHGAADHA
jgi:O-antigen ligase